MTFGIKSDKRFVSNCKFLNIRDWFPHRSMSCLRAGAASDLRILGAIHQVWQSKWPINV